MENLCHLRSTIVCFRRHRTSLFSLISLGDLSHYKILTYQQTIEFPNLGQGASSMSFECDFSLACKHLTNANFVVHMIWTKAIQALARL